MLHGKIEDSIYSKSIKSLIKRIHDSTHVQDSLYEQAINYFKEQAEIEKQLAYAEENLVETKSLIATNKDKKLNASLQNKLEKAQKTQQTLKLQEEKKRQGRYEAVLKICNEIRISAIICVIDS